MITALSTSRRKGLCAALFLITAFHSYALSSTLSELSSTAEWTNLVHYQEGTGFRITEPLFFANGLPASPQDELGFLIDNQSCELVCRFPARYDFIRRHLAIDISFDHCIDWLRFSENIDPDSVSIFFASSYLGSPMSYFGHTFLRFNKANNQSFSYTVNFAGEIPDGSGFLNTAIRGVTGRMSGVYSIVPHYIMVEKYQSTEQRTLWEYELNLSRAELTRLLMYVYELSGRSMSYHFVNFNCTSALVPLLRAARPELDLERLVGNVVTPAALIHVLESEGVVEHLSLHQSVVERLAERWETTDRRHRRVFRQANRSRQPASVLNMSDGDSSSFELDRVIELLHLTYLLQFKRFGRVMPEFNEVMSLSFNPVTTLEPEPSSPTAPNRRMSFAEISLASVEGELYSRLALRALFSDRRDRRFSSNADGTIEIFRSSLDIGIDSIHVQSIDLVRIESLPPLSPFFKLPSWAIYSGWNRSNANRILLHETSAGMGVTIGGPNTILFVIPSVMTYSLPFSIHPVVYSGISWRFSRVHLGVDSRVFPLLDNLTGASVTDVFLVARLTQNSSLVANYVVERQDAQIGVRISF